MTRQQYRIVSGRSEQEVATEVTYLLSKGWILAGGLVAFDGRFFQPLLLTEAADSYVTGV